MVNANCSPRQSDSLLKQQDQQLFLQSVPKALVDSSSEWHNDQIFPWKAPEEEATSK